MPAEKPSQSFSVSGGELQNVQIGGQAVGDLTANQIQQISQGEPDQGYIFIHRSLMEHFDQV